MTDTTNFRMERIEKLLAELRYEIERGMLERDIGEEIPDGVVFCEFRTRPVPRMAMNQDGFEPRLKLVKG